MPTSLKKEFLVATLLQVEWPFFFFVHFLSFRKKVSHHPKGNSCILLFNVKKEVKMPYCSEASCLSPRPLVTIQRSTHLTTNMDICSVNSWSSVFQPPPPRQPTFLTGNCRFISFTVSLATLAERPGRFHQEKVQQWSHYLLHGSSADVDWHALQPHSTLPCLPQPLTLEST